MGIADLSRTRDLSVVHAAQESCKKVNMSRFYPEQKVELNCIELFKPTLNQRLALTGARLAGLLKQARN